MNFIQKYVSYIRIITFLPFLINLGNIFWYFTLFIRCLECLMSFLESGSSNGSRIDSTLFDSPLHAHWMHRQKHLPWFLKWTFVHGKRYSACLYNRKRVGTWKASGHLNKIINEPIISIIKCLVRVLTTVQQGYIRTRVAAHTRARMWTITLYNKAMEERASRSSVVFS